jgi:hypothetical protein
VSIASREFVPQFNQHSPGVVVGYSETDVKARMPKLKAPFPAFGGKSKVASLVWDRLGDVDNYIEPFCNSAACLLSRPHEPRVETINDWDCYVANFWRATAHDPEAVAVHADNPVNEADLHARHRWLVLSDYAAYFRAMIRTNPDFYDAKVAGYWCWGACCWIGSGWCQEPQQLPHLSHAGQGLTQQLPHLDPGGRKVATGPEASELNGRRGVLSQQLPELNGKPGRVELSQQMPFVNKFGADCVPECSASPRKGLDDTHRPQLADAYSRGRGVNGHDEAGTCAQRRAWLLDWFGRLRDRLRTVRVCCGDWIRVCDSPSTTTRLGTTGIFLDPPYRTHLEDGKSNRAKELYASDRDQDVGALVDRVIAYCLERGGDPDMRLAVCCYEGEGYEVLADSGWTVESWKASGGYGNQSGQVNENAARERIWFSPNCRQPAQRGLFT